MITQAYLSLNESADERSTRELGKLLRKLRWIGENEEADKLQGNLRLRNTRDCVIALPVDTD